MRLWLIGVISAIAVWPGAAVSAQYYFPGPIDPPPADSIEEISLARGCGLSDLETEPRQLIFRRDGVATNTTYHICDRCLPPIRQALKSVLTRKQFTELVEVLFHERFFGLKDEYADRVSKNKKQCSAITNVIFRDGRKSIGHTNDVGPPSVKAVENAIESLAKTLTWVTVE
jgi:hypothetical protein